AESLEAGLELRFGTQRKADSPWPGSPESVPMPSHLQLQELDAYAELVEQLRSEVAMERAEREVSARNLAALRDSYRLLLLRSSRDCSNQTPVKASMAAVPTAVPPIVH
ncbi:ATP5B, partial [Symbiodinium sp. CCMP2456]